MPRIDKALIEFKGSTLPVVFVSLRSLQPEALAAAAIALFGDDRFFDGDAALLDLSHLVDERQADWPQLKELFAAHGLQVIGVRGGCDELRQNAEHAGLPCFALIERAPRAAPKHAAPPATPPVQEVIEPAPSTVPSTAPSTVPNAASVPTLVIDRPLRSGQQVYARGGDLVVLAAVNAGAEVIADGSIHIYAPLRGRALAGASGAANARIFTTRFEAELVSIAGVYRTFETGVPGDLAGKPAQVQLIESPADQPGAATSTLTIEPLKTS
jgi:septum site-determining protein MinC